MAFHHRHGIAQHLGNVLDQCTVADIPHRAGVTELVRMRWTHSEVGLYLGDLGAFEQILKLDTPRGFVALQLEVGTAERLALWQLFQQRDHTSRKHYDCAFASLWRL
jgi:hypothetical protein